MTWYNNSWNYRKPITISNAGSSLTDYQVPVTIDTASLVSSSKLLSNCNDIRFTSNDGSTLLNYWIESGCNTSSTKIWAKIPSIATGSNTIYLYYGNSGASSASNGTNTFDFFDDFSGDLSKWTQTKNPSTSTISIVSGELQIWDNPAGPNWTDTYVTATLPAPTNGYFLQGKMKTSAVSGGGWSISLDGSPQYINVRADHTPQYILYYAGTSASISQSISANVYDTVQIYYDGTTHYAKVVEKPAISRSGASIYKPTTIRLSSFTETGSHIITFDDIRVRKYTSPEPTLSTIGTEETPSPANIAATLMTITPSATPCIEGNCTMTVDVTWTNTGETSGTFLPNIKIDTVAIPLTPFPSESLGAGNSILHTFIVSGLTAGQHSICPYPN